MTKNPKVSIIIPVYNGSNYLKEAIDSALNQTYANVEVIVVNDGSNDNGKTENIAKCYSDKIKYFYKENGGVASALNFGISVMEGEYFSWLSHDDIYKSFKIEKQLDYLNNLILKDVILYSNYEIIDENSKLIKKKVIKQGHPERIKVDLILDYPINGCTVLLPKKCFNKVGLFNEGLITTQDYDMWYRLSRKYEYFYIPEVLVSSRIHPNQNTNLINDIHRQEVNDFYINTLNKITEKEVIDSGIKSIRLFYLNAAINLKRRFFQKSSEYSFYLANSKSDKNNFKYLLKITIYFLNFYFVNKVFNFIKRKFFNIFF